MNRVLGSFRTRRGIGVRRPAGIIFLLALLLTPGQRDSAAAQSTVTILNDNAWVDFPESVDFQLKFTASAEVTAVQLAYGISARTCGPIQAVRNVAFTAGDAVEATWRWEILADQIIPPGGQFWWQWTITLADGTVVAADRQTATFIDPWFVWQSVSAANLTVHWYRGSRALAESMRDIALEAVDELAVTTGVRVTEPIDLFLYEEPFDIRISIPGAPAWVGGVAFPEYNIVLAVAREDYVAASADTVKHEIGHVVIGQLTFNCVADLPTWLSEGLAMVAEGDPDPRLEAILSEAIAAEHLLGLRQLEGSFSIHTDRARLSYAQSDSIVRFLIDSYGVDAMLTFLETMAGGVGIDNALQTAFGLDTPALEAAWLNSLGLDGAAAAPANAGAPTAVATLALLTNATAAPSPTPTAAATATMTPGAANTAAPTPPPAATSTPAAVATAPPAPEGPAAATPGRFAAAGAAFVLILAALWLWRRFGHQRP